MGNLLCILAQCSRRGSEIIVGDESHIHIYEQGNSATIGGVHSRAVPNLRDGSLDLQEISTRIRTKDDHYPTTQLICLENTHNRCGGTVLSAEYIDSVGELAHKHGIKLHMDGARLMNAVVRLGIPAARLVRACDTVSLCLSKGLAAPVGSLVSGTAEFVSEARRLRKALGGGWRQAGVLAAAGLVAVNKMVDRLVVDHDHAQLLASKLSTIEGIVLKTHLPQDRKIEQYRDPLYTNLIFFEIDTKLVDLEFGQVIAELRKGGVLIGGHPPRFRIVLHYHVTRDDVQRIYDLFCQILTKHKRKPIGKL